MRAAQFRPEQQAQKFCPWVRKRMIGVAAGLAQRLAGDEQPRADEQALFHRSLEAPVGAAGVAQRGEAAVQHRAHGDGAFGGQQGQGHVGEQLQVDLGQHDVDVRVDQAGHQGAVADVDALGVGRGDRAIGDFLDQGVLDEDFYPVVQFVEPRVQEASAGEEMLAHACLSKCFAAGQTSDPAAVRDAAPPPRRRSATAHAPRSRCERLGARRDRRRSVATRRSTRDWAGNSAIICEPQTEQNQRFLPGEEA